MGTLIAFGVEELQNQHESLTPKLNSLRKNNGFPERHWHRWMWQTKYLLKEPTSDTTDNLIKDAKLTELAWRWMSRFLPLSGDASQVYPSRLSEMLTVF